MKTPNYAPANRCPFCGQRWLSLDVEALPFLVFSSGVKHS